MSSRSFQNFLSLSDCTPYICSRGASCGVRSQIAIDHLYFENYNEETTLGLNAWLMNSALPKSAILIWMVNRECCADATGRDLCSVLNLNSTTSPGQHSPSMDCACAC